MVGDEVSKKSDSNISLCNRNPKTTKLNLVCFATLVLLHLQLTWADIAVAGFLDLCLPDVKVEGMEQFVAMTDLMKKVFETPNLKKYVETRPKTFG